MNDTDRAKAIISQLAKLLNDEFDRRHDALDVDSSTWRSVPTFKRICDIISCKAHFEGWLWCVGNGIPSRYSFDAMMKYCIESFPDVMRCIVDESALDRLWENGRKAWADVDSPTAFVEQIRGNTDEKQEGKNNG